MMLDVRRSTMEYASGARAATWGIVHKAASRGTRFLSAISPKAASRRRIPRWRQLAWSYEAFMKKKGASFVRERSPPGVECSWQSPFICLRRCQRHWGRAGALTHGRRSRLIERSLRGACSLTTASPVSPIPRAKDDVLPEESDNRTPFGSSPLGGSRPLPFCCFAFHSTCTWVSAGEKTGTGGDQGPLTNTKGTRQEWMRCMPLWDFCYMLASIFGYPGQV